MKVTVDVRLLERMLRKARAQASEKNINKGMVRSNMTNSDCISSREIYDAAFLNGVASGLRMAIFTITGRGNL